MRGLARDIQEASSAAEDYKDLIKRLLEVHDEYGTPDRLKTEAHEEMDRDPHTEELLYDGCRRSLDEIDKVAGTNHHDALERFVRDLHEQRVLSQVSMVLLQFFARDQEFLFKYTQMLYWDLPQLVADMLAGDDPEETTVRDLIRMYKEWGEMCETAVEPMVSVIHFLVEGEVNLERGADMRLQNQVDELDKVPDLQGLCQCLNVDYRNAVSHGGKKGGYQVNRMVQEILLWYEGEEEQQMETAGFEQFRKLTIRTFSAVAALSLLPMYLVSAYATFGIEEAEESPRRKLKT